MDISALDRDFKIAFETTDYTQHQEFTKELLASNETEIISYHFNLLKKRENWKLYQQVRQAFLKRGVEGENFLIMRMKSEDDPELQGDALFLLGLLRSKEALALARSFVSHQDPDHRYKACVVLGWIGTENDIDILRDLLLNDPKALIRGYAATAQRQLWRRLPETKSKILANLKKALGSEVDEDAISLIIVSIQTILNKGLGLKEDIHEGKITGNVQNARNKALKALE